METNQTLILLPINLCKKIFTVDQPNITQGPVSITVLENSSVAFTCEADANPPAEFQWLLDNRRLTSNDTGVTIAGGCLMITMASSLYVGEIACVVVNVEGTISSIATLTVLCKKNNDP